MSFLATASLNFSPTDLGERIGVNGGVVAGGILIQMNTNGNPSTLVAAHPGNTNAVKHGVYSSRFIQFRAAEIIANLTESFEFSVMQHIAVEQAARCMAILELIDCDLDERGLVDKRGAAHSLLNYRSRISRQLDRELSKIAPTIERQLARDQPSPPPGRPDYIGELQRMALGDDTTASARDRASALKTLVEIDSQPGGVTVVQLSIPVDRMPRRLQPKTPADDGNAADLSTPL